MYVIKRYFFLFFETTSCLAFLKIFKQTCWSHLVTLEEQTLLLRTERVKEPLKTRSILNGIKLEWNILFKNFKSIIECSNVSDFGNQLLLVKFSSENQCLATSFRAKYWTFIKNVLVFIHTFSSVVAFIRCLCRARAPRTFIEHVKLFSLRLLLYVHHPLILLYFYLNE